LLTVTGSSFFVWPPVTALAARASTCASLMKAFDAASCSEMVR
jgi:hypothetical protein